VEGGTIILSYWECCFKYAECHNCGCKGHIARGCCSKGAPFKAKTLEKPGNRRQRAGAKWVQANRESGGFYGVQDQRQRSSTHYSAAAYQWKSIDHGSWYRCNISIISTQTHKKFFQKGPTSTDQYQAKDLYGWGYASAGRDSSGCFYWGSAFDCVNRSTNLGWRLTLLLFHKHAHIHKSYIYMVITK